MFVLLLQRTLFLNNLRSVISFSFCMREFLRDICYCLQPKDILFSNTSTLFSMHYLHVSTFMTEIEPRAFVQFYWVFLGNYLNIVLLGKGIGKH